MPAYDGNTTHAWVYPNEGGGYPLRSNAHYPSAWHAEGDAAIVLRRLGSSGGILYHNNPEGTCGLCRTNVKRLLPEGATLLIVPPKHAFARNSQAMARPEFHRGNSEQPIPNEAIGSEVEP
jgi:hypothetical protein